ncbi:F-box/kelch-repeat protein SKIP25-like [Rutidosis leptorrhynchoides]|uniref:F-box/kelch-repeat protein SKIP25-like n=1 Tax=Rutidosis leptorrhynchoides TaxID=125765 RepID=UPI003A9A0CCF
MANETTISRATTCPTTKRPNFSDDHHHSLLPGLPDHIAHLCLSLISPTILYSVCRSWRRLLYSATFPPFRSFYTLSLPTTASGGGDGRHTQTLKVHSFDPISSKWITIDSPPPPSYLRRLSVRHPSFISRNLPIQSLSISGHLVLLAASSVHQNLLIPAFPHPLIYNPLSNTWSSSPPLATPRRWCAAGVHQETVVVASGIGSHYSETVAQSVEKWVLRKTESLDIKHIFSNGNCKIIKSIESSKLNVESFDQKRYNSYEKVLFFKNSERKMQSFDNKRYGNYEKVQTFKNLEVKIESLDHNGNENYEKIRHLKNSNKNSESFGKNSSGDWEKMQPLKHSKLCREAIDAIGWKRKLCMVGVKGDYAKEGFVYNLDSDEWSEMPAGMLGGWKGPAAAMDEEIIYVVDETKGVLKKYNEDGDNWSEIVVDERLKGAEYIAAGGGRVCVVCEKDVGILVVDVVAAPPRLWLVETPPGHQIMGVHILPRMCLPEFLFPVSEGESK